MDCSTFITVACYCNDKIIINYLVFRILLNYRWQEVNFHLLVREEIVSVESKRKRET